MPENDNIDTSFGDLAQLVEHTAHIRVVSGSIPLVAKKRLSCLGKSFFLRFYKFKYKKNVIQKTSILSFE